MLYQDKKNYWSGQIGRVFKTMKLFCVYFYLWITEMDKIASWSEFWFNANYNGYVKPTHFKTIYGKIHSSSRSRMFGVSSADWERTRIS